MAKVILDGIKKVYDNALVSVRDVSFEVNDGEFVVLVGPSGCGKTTILRMIAGLETITAGTLSIGDRVINAVPAQDRDVAMVFQHYALYPHMSVFDNMAFGLKLRKYPKDEIKVRVEAASKTLGIADILDRKPKQLSGGERQRVAVGRAIVRKPNVFLFDEPLSNLDAKLRVQMRTEISRLQRQLGATMIYVTHDQVEAMTMGDRIVVLKAGEIQQMDAPLALYHHPVNQFVAGFIGSPSMNFITGHIVQQAGLFFRSEDGEFSCSLDLVPEAVAHMDKPLILGIRPEDIYVAGHVPPNITHVSVGAFELEVIEPMGNEMILYLKGSDAFLVARVVPQPLPAIGALLPLVFDTTKLHFFDAETKRSLS